MKHTRHHLLWVAALVLAIATLLGVSDASQSPAPDLAATAMAATDPTQSPRSPTSVAGPQAATGEVIESTSPLRTAVASPSTLGKANVRIQVTPAPPGGVPIEVVWLPEARHDAVATALRTDASGVAHAEMQPPRGTTAPIADFGFPTAGAHAMPLPLDGGSANLALPALGELVVHVREAGGIRLTERAELRLRVLDACPPADRWHVRALQGGNGQLECEASSLELLVEVRTASGRVGSRIARGPSEPGMHSTCVLILPMADAVEFELLLPTGEPLGDRAVEVVDALRRTSITGYTLRTDAAGRVVVYLPENVKQCGRPLRLLALADLPAGAHHAELSLPPSLLQYGGRAGTLRMTPSDSLVSGIVVSSRGEPMADAEVLLDFSPAPHDEPEASDWVRLATARSGPDGSFAVRTAAPEGGRLWVRLGGLGRGRAQPVAVQPGELHVRLTVADGARVPPSRTDRR